MEPEFYISGQMKYAKYKKAGEITTFVQYGTSKELNEIKEGYPILRLNEFDSSFISEPTKYCSLIDEDDYNSLKLQKNDVLICRTNGNPKLVGRSALVPKNYEYAFASYLFRVRPDRHYIYPATLVSFLNSKYGRMEIEKYSMVGNQANFSPAKFREISIPLFSRDFNETIEVLTYNAFENIDRSNTKYKEVEDYLSDLLGLSNIKGNNNAMTKRVSDSFLISGRLDAEYYLPQYDDLFELLEQFETKKLGSIVTIQKSVEPGSCYYQTKGIPFVRVADLSIFGLKEPSIYLDKDAFADVMRPKGNTILMSKDGSVGIAYKVTEDINCITSSAILHLFVNDNSILPDYLTLVINSQVVQMQAERDAGGSIIQHWKPSEISDVIIPILPMEEQIRISSEVQESFKLRHESKRLLGVAKQAVEIAISEDEEKAIEYIKENGESLLGRQI